MSLRGWLWRIARRVLADVLEAGALYFDAVNDRQHKPPPKPAPDFDNETTPTLRCRHNARLNERCLKCDPP